MSKRLEELPDAVLSPSGLLYIVDGDGNSRKVSLADLTQWIRTTESILPESLPYRGARVVRTSDTSGLMVPTALFWQAAERDTDGFWSLGAGARLVVPPGVSKVRLQGAVALADTAVAGSLRMEVRRNGDSVSGAASHNVRQSGTGLPGSAFAVVTDALDVQEGDYFELWLDRSGLGSAQVLASPATFFAIEVVEAMVEP